MIEPLARIDGLLGRGVEPAVQRYHRRRLTGLGQDGAVDPCAGVLALAEAVHAARRP